MKRRIFLKGSVAASTLAVAAGAGLLSPTRVLAAAWPESAFGPRPEAEALEAFFGSSDVVESDAVSLKAPLQAENGAVVPIKVMTSLADVESIGVIVVKPSSFYNRTRGDGRWRRRDVQCANQDGTDVTGKLLRQSRR